MINRCYWKGRRVFLTGHTGFKGSWLSLWLNALGADVTGYALEPPTRPSLFDQAGVSRVVKSICADVRDFPRLKVTIAESRPEVVIHMAAQSVVRQRLRGPDRNLLVQCDGDRPSSRGTAAVRTAMRGGQHYER